VAYSPYDQPLLRQQATAPANDDGTPSTTTGVAVALALRRFMGVSQEPPRSAVDTECVVSTTAPTETHRVLVVDDESNISYLRKKLDKHGAPRIHTARSVGCTLHARRA
jgi:hypothetical protein